MPYNANPTPQSDQRSKDRHAVGTVKSLNNEQVVGEQQGGSEIFKVAGVGDPKKRWAEG